MRLIRGWEKRYAPDATGGLRLSQARRYREIGEGEEEGLEDVREGEVRVRMEGKVNDTWEENKDFPIRLSPESQERRDAESARLTRELLSAELDDPDIDLEKQGTGNWTLLQNVKIEDSELASPFLLCLSREPESISEWESLRAALPERYDTWTVTEDLSKLRFEIKCGIRRWIALTAITEHRITSYLSWVTYSYHSAPPSDNIEEVGWSMTRWFRKGRKYRDQEEYRVAWDLRSPQIKDLPDFIDIELTRTGLSLFQPWTPPGR